MSCLNRTINLMLYGLILHTAFATEQICSDSKNKLPFRAHQHALV